MRTKKNRKGCEKKNNEIREKIMKGETKLLKNDEITTHRLTLMKKR